MPKHLTTSANSELSSKQVKSIIISALQEDLGEAGDLTSNLILKSSDTLSFVIRNRVKMVLCGVDLVELVFLEAAKYLNLTLPLNIQKHYRDGAFLEKNQIIISGRGSARLVLAAERLALNLLQHLSGIATNTRLYVEKLNDKRISILDTRKTVPNLRILQKYAVKTGGGANHRLGLYDAVLIKDNHIAAAGGTAQAIALAKEGLKKVSHALTQPLVSKLIEVECDDIGQVKEALNAGADIIMLDNMNLRQIKMAVSLINGKAKIEVSGGVNLRKIKAFRGLAIDYISIGALTHSVKAVDIGLDITNSNL